jgi:metal-responsive CopG/Arc/MetJ family transcriptional regulator
MAMRCSFALDPGLLEQIDQYARDNTLDRNEAILELIETGLTRREDDRPLPVRPQRSSEELDSLRR